MEITYTKTYQEYKAELDTELSKTAEGFVRIGYLLKIARDTDILKESPYGNVIEFAKIVYGIDKTMVSRFISINDRFSEGGYSDQLQEQYRGYGYTKLTLMLSLPDEINAELSPSYSKSEIQAIKDEVDEERAISDLEVMLEDKPAQPSSGILSALIRQLGQDDPELYIQMAKLIHLEDMQEWTHQAKETLAPNGEKQYSIRISGVGRFLTSIRETEDTITATALRTMEKHRFTYEDLRAAWEEILPPSNGQPDTAWTEEQCRTSWELEYDQKFPKSAEVAPVQQQRKPGKPESKPIPRKESKVQKAPKPAPPKKTPPAPIPAPIPEEEKTPAENPEKPESTGTEAAGQPTQEPETYEQPQQEPKPIPEEPEKPEKTGTEQPEEQLPGQIGIEEAIEEAEERNGAVMYIEPDDNPVMAAEQLDKEWEKEKEEFLDKLKRLDTEGALLSRNLSQIPYVHIAAFRIMMIDMAALIEKELLRRGEKF